MMATRRPAAATPLTLKRIGFFSFFVAALLFIAPEATAAAAAALSGTNTDRSDHTRSTGCVLVDSLAASARAEIEGLREGAAEEAGDGETLESLSSDASSCSRCFLCLRSFAAPARARMPWTAAAPAATVSWCCGAAMAAAPCFFFLCVGGVFAIRLFVQVEEKEREQDGDDVVVDRRSSSLSLSSECGARSTASEP